MIYIYIAYTTCINMYYEYITYIRNRSILFHEVWAQGTSSLNSLRLTKLLSYHDPASADEATSSRSPLDSTTADDATAPRSQQDSTTAEVSTSPQDCACLRDLLPLSGRASLSSSVWPMQRMFPLDMQ